MSDEDFEVIVVEAPKIEIDIPREKLLSFIRLAEELGWEKSRLKRYISTALRLRNLERKYGKSYVSLVKSYEKLSSEEVKLRYSIEQLLEKRKRIEEDLNLYLEQHKLTLDLVQRLGKLYSELRDRGLNLEDLEKALNTLELMRDAGYDVENVLNRLSKLESYERKLEEIERIVKEKRGEVEELEERKRRILKEIEGLYGISGELGELKNAREKLREEIEQMRKELEENSSKLEEAKAELAEIMGHKASLEELRRLVDELRSEADRLSEEKEKLSREISELLGTRAEIDEIRRKMSEEREKLEEVEKEIENRQSYLDILEGEIAASYAILKIFTDPQGVDVEDLEPLADQLQKILKIKRGELPALKPLEPHMINRVKESLVSLVAPHLKGEFVPRKMFEQLEREVRKLNERREALEEELNSLKRLLEEKAVQQPKKPLLEALGPEGEPIDLKTLDRGKRFKIRCPSCGASFIISIPVKEELEELSSKGCHLRFTCGECGKSFPISLEALLKKLEA
ncbi:MAG: hypothetical protein J7L79_02820 [Thaumarchaeota archaeon]|nr:hypothetical protein [Nitrososphaerota archaeon]